MDRRIPGAVKALDGLKQTAHALLVKVVVGQAAALGMTAGISSYQTLMGQHQPVPRALVTPRYAREKKILLGGVQARPLLRHGVPPQLTPWLGLRHGQGEPAQPHRQHASQAWQRSR